MGNLVSTFTAFISPVITDIYVMPMLFSPNLLGGIPFKPPGLFENLFYELLINFLIIGSMATLAGSMSSLAECRKSKIKQSLLNSRYVLLGALVGFIASKTLLFIKAPLLSVSSLLPYAIHFTTGIFVAFFVLIFGIYGNYKTRSDVC